MKIIRYQSERFAIRAFDEGLSYPENHISFDPGMPSFPAPFEPKKMNDSYFGSMALCQTREFPSTRSYFPRDEPCGQTLKTVYQSDAFAFSISLRTLVTPKVVSHLILESHRFFKENGPRLHGIATEKEISSNRIQSIGSRDDACGQPIFCYLRSLVNLKAVSHLSLESHHFLVLSSPRKTIIWALPSSRCYKIDSYCR